MEDSFNRRGIPIYVHHAKSWNDYIWCEYNDIILEIFQCIASILGIRICVVLHFPSHRPVPDLRIASFLTHVLTGAEVPDGSLRSEQGPW